MPLVICYDIKGTAVSVPSNTLTYQIAVYGILIEREQILLIRHPQTNLWHPPGDVLQGQDAPTSAIRHHFRQVTGMTLRLGALLLVEEKYVIDETDQPQHRSILYYALDRPQVTTASLTEIKQENQPEWLDIADLNRTQLQFGFNAIMAGHLRLKSNPSP